MRVLFTLITFLCYVTYELTALNQFCFLPEDKYNGYLECRKLGTEQKMEDLIKRCHTEYKPSSIEYGTPPTYNILQDRCLVSAKFSKCVADVMNSTEYLALKPLSRTKEEKECLQKVFSRDN